MWIGLHGAPGAQIWSGFGYAAAGFCGVASETSKIGAGSSVRSAPGVDVTVRSVIFVMRPLVGSSGFVGSNAGRDRSYSTFAPETPSQNESDLRPWFTPTSSAPWI